MAKISSDGTTYTMISQGETWTATANETFPVDLEWGVSSPSGLPAPDIDFQNCKWVALEPVADSPELVENGGFDSDTDWTKGTVWTISGGKATATSASSGQLIGQSFTPDAGKQYLVGYDIVDEATSGEFKIYVFGTLSSGASTIGRHEYIITANADSNIYVRASGTTSGSIDNVSVKEVTTPSGELLDRDFAFLKAHESGDGNLFLKIDCDEGEGSVEDLGQYSLEKTFDAAEEAKNDAYWTQCD